jgi:hypothetical protein
MSVPRSPPCSGILVAVFAVCHWTPLPPLSTVLPLSSRLSKLLVPDNKLEARFNLVRLAC